MILAYREKPYYVLASKTAHWIHDICATHIT